MEIKLNTLEYQKNCIDSICKVFEGIEIKRDANNHSNPIFNTDDSMILSNIREVQRGAFGVKIPNKLQTRDESHFGIDVKMETGTGKTYCYTKLMYELNKKYGFNKFIILVPTTPIKEGTKAFIEANYSKRHFADIYKGQKISLSVLDQQKQKKGRKQFPQAISNFSRITNLEKGTIACLLMGRGMFLSKQTMEYEYDQTIDNFTVPYDVLKATRAIVIIDEPHKFKKEDSTYKKLLEKIDPLCVIRFGATFPEKTKTKNKDYNNVVYNLGSCESFNENLIKGIKIQMIEQESENETKIKLMELSKSPKFCVFRNEKTQKTYKLGLGETLSIIDNKFNGITVSVIGKTSNEDIKTGVELSNGQVLAKGDQIYAGIYGTTYQDLMMEQAIENHIKQEKDNFFREVKIKTLTLFFIDSVYSYRGENGEGLLRKRFQTLLKAKLEKELEKIKKENVEDAKTKEYISFIKSSINDISKTNGGYFAKDNSTSEEDIKNEIDQILRDKQSLLSFKDENGEWNTRRFIFSKWTLREGWDNPNVFQICKLRSSGSEISKLQEVGRGLRLPIDENGNRISKEQFYLTYLFDYSEKNFAESLQKEIENDNEFREINIKNYISKMAERSNTTENNKFIELLQNGCIDINGNVLPGNEYKLSLECPELKLGLQQNKIINKNKNEKEYIGIRKEKFKEIKKLWEQITKKYYIYLENISEDELYTSVLDILNNKKIDENIYMRTVEKTVKISDEGNLFFKENTLATHSIDEVIPYGEFLKKINKSTSIPIKILHKALCEYSKTRKLENTFFNRKSISNFIMQFQEWFKNTFINKFSYKALNINSLETSLTTFNGEPKEWIIQGTLGVFKEPERDAPEKFLYDQIIYDSNKEKENIHNSDIDEVVVFGKIPRKSIRIPLYFGGTTSPDFMYVIKKEDQTEISCIIETKDVEDTSILREIEKLKIKSAEKFFEVLKENGINVKFKKQLKNEDVVGIIKNVEKSI